MRAGDSRGFTLIELLIVVAVIGAIAAMAIGGLLGARRAANEASAIGSMRTINNAQQAFSTSCARGYFASALPILASAPAGGAAFISSDLGSAVTVNKSGYEIALARATDGSAAPEDACNPLGTAEDIVTSYYATASPESWVNGNRYFWTNTLGAIYSNLDGPIEHTEGATSPPAPAVPLETEP